MYDFVIELKDTRMVYLEKILVQNGYSVIDYRAFDGSRSAIYVFSPARRFKEDELAFLAKNSIIYAGNIDERGKEVLRSRGIAHVNMLKDEIFAYENAIYTAEAALMLIIRNTSKSVYDMNMLIMGYGRVGKAMAQLLNSLGVRFAVAARNYVERAAARLTTDDVRDLSTSFEGVDVIVNTIPAEIVAAEMLLSIRKECYILELASMNVLDAEEAEKLELKYDIALGLPGKFTPESAGKSLAGAIIRSLQ